MSAEPDALQARNQSPSAGLLVDTRRAALELAVTAYLGRPWRVTAFTDLIDLASHGCAILSDGRDAVFAKLSEAANGQDQFEVELAGLRYLAEQAGARVPIPIGVISVPGGVILLLEAARAVERGPREWRDIGGTLARIHRLRGATWGFPRQGYFGPLYQDNRSTPDWLSFFTERRMWPRLMEAIDSGHLPTDSIRQVERLIARLPRLEIPDCAPCLLHGDAQQNNFISTAEGALVIDPAIYYGHPEMDLALIDYFQPVPGDVLDGYREVLPIEPGFSARRDLWRVPACLAVVAVGGPAYLEMLTHAVQPYL